MSIATQKRSNSHDVKDVQRLLREYEREKRGMIEEYLKGDSDDYNALFDRLDAAKDRYATLLQASINGNARQVLGSMDPKYRRLYLELARK